VRPLVGLPGPLARRQRRKRATAGESPAASGRLSRIARVVSLPRDFVAATRRSTQTTLDASLALIAHAYRGTGDYQTPRGLRLPPVSREETY
jgi:hypothetical protein